MSKQIFISHSSKDKERALSLCHSLEERGYSCWIGVRDIQAGESYPKSIMKAINECIVFILLYSNDSNKSEHVVNETDIAFNANKVIITLRLDDTPMAKEFVYYLCRKQWISLSSFLKNPDCMFLPIAEAIGQKAEKQPEVEKQQETEETKNIYGFFASKKTDNDYIVKFCFGDRLYVDSFSKEYYENTWYKDLAKRLLTKSPCKSTDTMACLATSDFDGYKMLLLYRQADDLDMMLSIIKKWNVEYLRLLHWGQCLAGRNVDTENEVKELHQFGSEYCAVDLADGVIEILFTYQGNDPESIFKSLEISKDDAKLIKYDTVDMLRMGVLEGAVDMDFLIRGISSNHNHNGDYLLLPVTTFPVHVCCFENGVTRDCFELLPSNTTYPCRESIDIDNNYHKIKVVYGPFSKEFDVQGISLQGGKQLKVTVDIDANNWPNFYVDSI